MTTSNVILISSLERIRMYNSSARLVFLDLVRPVQVDEQWDAAVESDSECFCFEMAALPEKKRTSPRGADTLTCSKQSVDSSALKINTKERDNNLFICVCARARNPSVPARHLWNRWERHNPQNRGTDSVKYYINHPECARCLTASDSKRGTEYLKDSHTTSLKFTGWKEF